MKVLFYALVIAAFLSSCGSEKTPAQKAEASTTPAAVPAPPPRYFSLQDGLEYGYEQAVSQDAKSKGQIASKVVMFKFLGERDGVLQFHTRDGDFHSVLQCERPCEFVKQMYFFSGKLQKKDHIRAVEGSIAWALTRDAMNGYLKRYAKEREGKLNELWFDESGPKWRPVAGS